MENLEEELEKLNGKQPTAEELIEYQTNGFQFLGKMVNRKSE